MAVGDIRTSDGLTVAVGASALGHPNCYGLGHSLDSELARVTIEQKIYTHDWTHHPILPATKDR